MATSAQRVLALAAVINFEIPGPLEEVTQLRLDLERTRLDLERARMSAEDMCARSRLDSEVYIDIVAALLVSRWRC